MMSMYFTTRPSARACRPRWAALTVQYGAGGRTSTSGGEGVGVGEGRADDDLQRPGRAVPPQLVVADYPDGGPRGVLDDLADLLHQRGAAKARADAVPQRVRRAEQPRHP